MQRKLPKIKLVAALTGTPLAIRQYDIVKGETRTAQFVATVNAHGRIPVLQIGEGDGARYLPESNAACWYLAEGSELIPQERVDRAEMLRWMFFEQYSHEPNVATLRFWLHIAGESTLTDLQRAMIPAKRAAGEEALALLDSRLARRDWLVGSAPTLADIALYPYTRVSGEGGFDLSAFPALGRWIERLESLDGFIAMA